MTEEIVVEVTVPEVTEPVIEVKEETTGVISAAVEVVEVATQLAGVIAGAAEVPVDNRLDIVIAELAALNAKVDALATAQIIEALVEEEEESEEEILLEEELPVEAAEVVEVVSEPQPRVEKKSRFI